MYQQKSGKQNSKDMNSQELADFESLDVLLQNAKPCDIFEQAMRRNHLSECLGLGTPHEQLLAMGYSRDEINTTRPTELSTIEQIRNWSLLANLCVGAEGPLEI